MRNVKAGFLRFWALGLVVLLVFSSCSETRRSAKIVPKGPYQTGLFILSDNAIDFIDGITFDLLPDVYQQENGESLGGAPSDARTYGNALYIVLPELHRILKLNRFTLKKEEVLDFESTKKPRFLTVYLDKIFVSLEGTDGQHELRAVDLESFQPVNDVALDFVPGKLFPFNDRIYVLPDEEADELNKIAVINPNSMGLETTLTVGFVPNSFTSLKTDIVISCAGKSGVEEENGSLWKLKEDGNVEKWVDWAEVSADEKQHVSDFGMAFDGNFYYLLNGALYSVPIDENPLNGTPVWDRKYRRLFVLGSEVVALSADNNEIHLFGGDAPTKILVSDSRPLLVAQ